LVVDAKGLPQRRLKRGEKCVKDRSWHVTLVISNTPGEADAVRWMCETYDETKTGIREIARALNERGIKSPQNWQWPTQRSPRSR